MNASDQQLPQDEKLGTFRVEVGFGGGGFRHQVRTGSGDGRPNGFGHCASPFLGAAGCRSGPGRRDGYCGDDRTRRVDNHFVYALGQFESEVLVSTGTTISVAAAAEQGRSTFVDEVLNRLVESDGLEVSDEVRDFILTNILRPDEEWFEGIREGRLNAQFTENVLRDALRESMSQQEHHFFAPDGRPVLGLEGVDEVFHSLPALRQCTFPFFC